jgi:hypothetical protein
VTDQTDRELIDEYIARMKAAGFDIPADILLDIAHADMQTLIDALPQPETQVLDPARLPVYTLTTRGAVPPPLQTGLVLGSNGWEKPRGVQTVMSSGISKNHNLLRNLGFADAGHTEFQAGFTILDTLGALTNAGGYLYNNGSGVLSYATPAQHAEVTVTDTDSIDLTISGQALSAAAKFGSTSTTVAAGNHAHSGVYEPVDSTIVRTGQTNYIDLTDGGATTLHSHAPDHAAVTLDVNADTLLSLSTQALGLDTQTATYVLAGPTSGIAAVPTFRALAATDIPALAYEPADATIVKTGNANWIDLTDSGATTLHSHSAPAGMGDVLDSGIVVGQLTKGVTDSKHITAAAIIPPASNILTLTNAAASTLGLAITAGKTLTLTSTGDFNLTVPATGTAALLATANVFTTNQKINCNSTTALLVEQTGVNNNVLVVDTTNGRVGIGKGSPDTRFHILGTSTITPTVTIENVNGHLWSFGGWTIADRFSITKNAVGDYILVNNATNIITFDCISTTGYITISRGLFGVGGIPTSKLHVIGTADIIQFRVQANATQTTNVFSLETSAAAVNISMDNNGGAIFNEQGNSLGDFRVEGDTEVNLAFADYSADTIAFGGTGASGATVSKGGHLTLPDINFLPSTPTTMAGDVNDYDLGTNTWIRLSGGAADRIITGIVARNDGHYMIKREWVKHRRQ